MRHDCPSDHHTYWWSYNGHRYSCTSYSSERLKRDTYRFYRVGRTFWCHRPPRLGA